VPEGFYEVVLKQEGYDDVFERVQVIAGETKIISKELSFKKGVCSISSTPGGASVYLDGKYKGKTPVVFIAEEAIHSLKIKKTGYNTISKEINVSYDEPLVVKEELHLSIFVYLAAAVVLFIGAFFVKKKQIPEVNIPLGNGILTKYGAKFRKIRKKGIKKRENIPPASSILTKYEAKFREIKKIGIKKRENVETDIEKGIEIGIETETGIETGKESSEKKNAEAEAGKEIPEKEQAGLEKGKMSLKTGKLDVETRTEANTGNLIELDKMPEPEFRYTVKKKEKD
jgi:hypothetical protein